MAETVESASVAPAVASPKKVAALKAKKLKSKPTHPATAEMVNAAIKELKERNGSSLQAIKKYVAATYKLDTDKFAPFIKRYLKSAVASGKLVQPKGKGASGSFKLAVKDSKPKAAKPAAASKVAKKPATKVAKKPASPKKASTTAPKAKKPVAEKKKATKVAAKPPKAKSTTAKPKVTKASPKTAKPKPAAKKSPAKPKKTAAKKIAKK